MPGLHGVEWEDVLNYVVGVLGKQIGLEMVHTLDSGCVLPLLLLLPEAFLLPPPLLMTIRDVNAVYSIDIKTPPCRLFVFCFCLTARRRRDDTQNYYV